jgi:hypothetical protein
MITSLLIDFSLQYYWLYEAALDVRIFTLKVYRCSMSYLMLSVSSFHLAISATPHWRLHGIPMCFARKQGRVLEYQKDWFRYDTTSFKPPNEVWIAMVLGPSSASESSNLFKGTGHPKLLTELRCLSTNIVRKVLILVNILMFCVTINIHENVNKMRKASLYVIYIILQSLK